MLVYRIEHPDTGMGPYSRYEGDNSMNELGQELCDTHAVSSEHPSPWDDGLQAFFLKHCSGSKCNAFFGCADPESLYTWFKPFWTRLMQLGYQMEVYRVKQYKVSKSGKQIAFDIMTAKRV